MLTAAFGASIMSRFKEGRKDTNDDASPGSPCMSTTDLNIESSKKMILYNHRSTFRESLLMMLAYRSAHAKKFLRMF